MGTLERSFSTVQMEELLASIAVLEDEREILQEQIISFKQELAIARQEKRLLMQEIEACNQDLRNLSQSSYDSYQKLLSERQAKQALEQELDKTRRLASCKLPQSHKIESKLEKELNKIWAQSTQRLIESTIAINKARQLRQQAEQQRQLRHR